MSEESILRELNEIGKKLDRMESRLDRASYDLETKLGRIMDDVDKRIADEIIKNRELELRIISLEKSFAPIKVFSYSLGTAVLTGAVGAMYAFLFKKTGGFP